MKKYCMIFILLVTLSMTSLAQDVKYRYCQLIGERKMLSSSVNVHLDMGYRYKPTVEEQKLIDELENYNSTVDALNRIAEEGWEPFLVVNAPSSTGSLVIHTMRKKK